MPRATVDEGAVAEVGVGRHLDLVGHGAGDRLPVQDDVLELEVGVVGRRGDLRGGDGATTNERAALGCGDLRLLSFAATTRQNQSPLVSGSGHDQRGALDLVGARAHEVAVAVHLDEVAGRARARGSRSAPAGPSAAGGRAVGRGHQHRHLDRRLGERRLDVAGGVAVAVKARTRQYWVPDLRLRVGA